MQSRRRKKRKGAAGEVEGRCVVAAERGKERSDGREVHRQKESGAILIRKVIDAQICSHPDASTTAFPLPIGWEASGLVAQSFLETL